MEEYRVLLADDEEEIRTGIGRKIDWPRLGFSLVGEAGNGEEALELAEQLRPDVVLTDIKMPFMDGLELCRRLRQSLPGAKLVVFSGFDDFEYARQAMGAGVSEYILKPINAPELMEVLAKLRRQLDEQRMERRDMETLRRRYDESLPVLRELSTPGCSADSSAPARSRTGPPGMRSSCLRGCGSPPWSTRTWEETEVRPAGTS